MTYVGKEFASKDDLKINALPHNEINELYNAIDLYLVSSRLEGGPKAILECAASQTKIISTDVGLVDDVLENEQIYNGFIEAKNLIVDDINNRILEKYRLVNYEKSKSFGFTQQAEFLKNLYLKIEKQPDKTKNNFKPIKTIKYNFIDKILKTKNKVTIFFKFHEGPWGGGNQFLKALAGELNRQNWKVENNINSRSKVLLFNSFLVDFGAIRKAKLYNKLVVNRIDGPTLLIRGKDEQIDDQIFAVNEKVADISVFQSTWSLFENMKLGFLPINPVLISNASDPTIFNTIDKHVFEPNKKVKLISTSWSNNKIKGGEIYKWLDRHLDWNKYEYTFVGRVEQKFENIKLIDPVPSEQLARILKQHDIFLTASDNDPCSNSVVEALSCGLPVIYYNRGGHSELVGLGGLNF